MRPILFDAEGRPALFRNDETGEEFRVDPGDTSPIVMPTKTYTKNERAAEALRRLRDPDPPSLEDDLAASMKVFINGVLRRRVL
jgi:hypothetical protein